MRVGILGSTELDFKPDDVFRYACNVISPHSVDIINTTEDIGVAETAREVAETQGIDLFVYHNYKDVIDNSDTVIVFRRKEEYPGYARYCGHKGRPFREYVVNTGR